MLLIGNPTTLAGTFYDAFHKNRQYWKTIYISAFDTPAFQKETYNRAFLHNRADHLLRGPDDHLRGIATPKWAKTSPTREALHLRRIRSVYSAISPTKRRAPIREVDLCCHVDARSHVIFFFSERFRFARSGQKVWGLIRLSFVVSLPNDLNRS